MAALLGMCIGNTGNTKTATSGGTPAGQSGLPPLPGTTATTLAPAASQPGATPTPSASAPTAPTEVAGGAATSIPASPVRVILEISPHTGPLTTDSFAVAGGWKLGWRFDCRGQGGSGPFHVSIQRPRGGEMAEDAAITRNGSGDDGIEEYSSGGEHVLVVETNCRWALKVTGRPG
jgi:hypothetical protein